MAWGKRLNRSVEEGCTYISPDYIWTFLYHDNALPREHLFLASWFRFRENGKSIVDTWQVVETISWNVLRSCGIKRLARCVRRMQYIFTSLFFTLVEKTNCSKLVYILCTERLFRGFLRVLEARWTVGGPPREIFPSFFEGGRSVSLSR